MYLLGSYDRNDIFQPSWRETNKTTPKLLALSPRPGPLRRRPPKVLALFCFFRLIGGGCRHLQEKTIVSILLLSFNRPSHQQRQQAWWFVLKYRVKRHKRGNT
jgi:hypothetical protein